MPINIRNNRSNLYDLQPWLKHYHSLPAYQEFRLQAPDLSLRSFKNLCHSQRKRQRIERIPFRRTRKNYKGLIAREARLAWKDRIEQSFPILRLAQKELSRKIQTLDESNTKMRTLNQKFLAFNMDIERGQGS